MPGENPLTAPHTSERDRKRRHDTGNEASSSAASSRVRPRLDAAAT
jgi:hypothetical protein